MPGRAEDNQTLLNQKEEVETEWSERLSIPHTGFITGNHTATEQQTQTINKYIRIAAHKYLWNAHLHTVGDYNTYTEHP